MNLEYAQKFQNNLEKCSMSGINFMTYANEEIFMIGNAIKFLIHFQSFIFLVTQHDHTLKDFTFEAEYIIPALLIKISNPLKSFSIFSTAFSMDAFDVTSRRMKHDLSPSSLSLLHASKPESSSRAAR